MISKQEECQETVLAAHKLIFLSGWSEELFEALANILQSKASHFAEIYGLEPPMCPVASSRRKKRKSLKKTPASDHIAGKGSAKSKVGNDELAIASGAAWQINEVLKAEEMRDAFLQSSYSEIAFSSLKVICTVYIEQCLFLPSLDLAPLLACLSLATNGALPDVDQTGISCYESSTANQALGHLLNCFDKLLHGPVQNPLSKLSQKRKASSKKHKQEGASQGNAMKGTVTVIMLGTSILKFIVDTTSIQLVNDDKVRCLNFASSYTKYAVSSIKKHEEHSSLFKGDDLKDALMLIRSCTYAAKLLHLVLGSSTELSCPPEDAFFLANHLLDLIPSIDAFIGSRFVFSFVSPLKQWLPVLILGLVCRWLIGPQNEMATDVCHFGDSGLPLWVTAMAKNELLDAAEPGQDEQSQPADEVEDSPLSRKLAEMMVMLLKKGSPKILDSVGGVLLSTLKMALQRSEYGIILGVTRFVCARLLGNNSLQLEMMQLTRDSPPKFL